MTKEEYLKQIEQDKTDLEINSDLTDQELYVCIECGSLDIEERMWVRVNTGFITDSCAEDECFCNKCLDTRQIIELQEFLKKI